MKILLSTTTSPLSAIIRTFTWSDYSHVDLVFEDDTIIAAVPFNGVMKDTLENRLKEASHYALYDIPNIDEAKAREIAESQIGKAYDWRGVIGVGFHRDWQRKDFWFCSEFATWVTIQAGNPILSADYFRRIVPGHVPFSPIVKLLESK